MSGPATSLLTLPTETDTLNPPTSYDQAVLAYGVFGIISLLESQYPVFKATVRSTLIPHCHTDDYLILITSRRRTIRILETDIYLATDFKMFPIHPPSPKLSDKLSKYKADEKYLLSLVKGHLYSGPFYYTYGGIDLTSRMQKQDFSSSRPMWQRVSVPCEMDQAVP